MKLSYPLHRFESFDEIAGWLLSFVLELQKNELTASASWDPGLIAAGAMEAKDVTVTGAELGDFAIASFSNDVQDLTLDAQVTTANTVTCVLSNNTGSAVDLAAGTVYVKVFKKET